MSQACPTPFICVGLLVSSRRIVAPLAPCLSRRFPSSVHVSLLRRGVSPCVGSRRDPWGGCGGSTYIALHRTWLVSSFLPGAFGAPVGVFCLRCGIPPVFMAIIWSVSLPPACPLRVTPYGVVPWTLAWLVTGWHSCPPPRFSRTLSFAVTSGHDSTVLLPPAIDSGESPSFTVGLTPCYCGVLGGLHVLVGSSTPSPGRLFEPSYLGRLLCLRLG